MKVHFVRINREELRAAIRLAYEGDESMRSIHILAGATLDEMTDYTWNQSVEDQDKAGQIFYAVHLPDNTRIGYTTLLLQPVKILFTFGINIAYRNREILQAWMKCVERHLGYSYMLTLRESNVRAVEFFKRYDFSVKHDKANKQYILWRQRQSSQVSVLPSR